MKFNASRYNMLTREDKILFGDTRWALSHILQAVKEEKEYYRTQVEPILTQMNSLPTELSPKQIYQIYPAIRENYPIIQLYLHTQNILVAAEEEKGWGRAEVAEDLEALLKFEEKLKLEDLAGSGRRERDPAVLTRKKAYFSGKYCRN